MARQELINPAPSYRDTFGISVAASGTLVAVCRPKVGGHVYDLAGLTPGAPIATLPVPSGSESYSVGISGTKVAVGATNASVGRVYVFDLTSGTPSVPVMILNVFARSLAMVGDRVAVSDGGKVYIFDLAGSTPTVPTVVLNKPAAAEADGFGMSVAFSANTVVVGAAYPGVTTATSGRVYVYDLAGATPDQPVHTLVNPGPSTDAFGISVAVSGTQVLVGASFDDTGASDAGKAYIFDLVASTPTQPVAVLGNPEPKQYDYFGQAVAMDGSIAVVGAPFASTTLDDWNGRAYVFGASEAFTATPTLIFPAVGTTLASVIQVSFSLPETALPSSVQLSFGATVLTLSASQETPGIHSFSFDPTNPTGSPQIVSGGPIADGTYTVTLRYQDADGNAAASAVAENVTVDAVDAPDLATLPPTLVSPASSSRFPGAVNVSFVLPEGAQPGSVKLGFGTRVLTVAAAHESAGVHSFSFDPANPTASGSIASGGIIMNGSYLVTLTYRDIAGNFPAVAVSHFVRVDGDAPAFVLMTPATGTRTKAPVSVSYRLSEAAQPGSLRLRFGENIMTLASSQESAGLHSFSFHPANPTASPQIASGGPIPDGTYIVGLSYRDAQGYTVASGNVSEVTLDTATLAPSSFNVSGGSGNTQMSVSFSLPEAAQPGSVKLDFGGRVLTLAAAHETEGYHSFYFVPATPLSSLHFASGGPLLDGTYNVVLSYRDALGNAVASDTLENFTLDRVTLPPALIAPVENSGSGAPVFVSFSLPEAARTGSLQLSFGPHVLTLASSQRTVGEHSFSFNPANPTASPEIASGPPVQPGTYSVTLSYRDARNNPVAVASAASFTVEAEDLVTRPPTLTSPRSAATYISSVNVAFSLPESAQPGSLQLNFGGTVLTLAASQATAGPHSFSFDPANPTASPQIASGGPVPDGVHTVTLSYRDIQGNAPASAEAANVEVFAILPEPSTTLLASKGAPVPGAGNGTSGIPAGAVWDTFGVPSVADNGQCAVLATLLSGAGKMTAILAWNAADVEGTTRVIAKVGDTVFPGAIIASMKEPALGANGVIAWFATLVGAPGSLGAVTSANNSVILASIPATGTAIIAREGTAAPGTAMAENEPVWSAFTSLAVGHSTVAFMAKLRVGTGGVTSASDTGLWVCHIAEDGSPSTALALRENEPLRGSTVRIIAAFAARGGSPGQGRGTVFNGSEDRTVVRVSLADGRQALGSIAQDGTTTFPYVTGDTVGGAYPSFQWRVFGLPTQNATSGAMSFTGSVMHSSGATASGLFAEDDTTFELASIAWKGTLAPGVGYLSTFKDPVNAGGRKVAFIGTLFVGNTITSSNDDGVWYYNATGTGNFVAREGTQAAEAPAGTTWKSFTSLALPEDRGPLFTAKLQGPGTTSANDDALWASDRFGGLRLIIREGDAVGSSTVKTITVLSSVTGSSAQTRSFAAGGAIILRVTDAAGAQHLLHSSVP